MWPSSAPLPVAPRYGFPSRIRPPPTPVPRVSITTYRAPRAAPACHSPIVAAFASLSIPTGTPWRSRIRSRKSTPASGMFTEATARPDRWSTRDGIPKPSAAISRLSRSSSTIASSPASSASCEEMSVGCTTSASISPCRSTTAASVFVPPTSTPMTRSASTSGGYHTPPDGVARRREAVSPLPRRARQGPRSYSLAVEAASPRATGAARREARLPRAGTAAEEGAPPGEADPLGPRDRDRAPALAALLHRVGGARLPRLPRRRLGGEQAPAEDRADRSHARQGVALRALDVDPAPRHRPLGAGLARGRPALGLDPALAHRPGTWTS